MCGSRTPSVPENVVSKRSGNLWQQTLNLKFLCDNEFSLPSLLGEEAWIPLHRLPQPREGRHARSKLLEKKFGEAKSQRKENWRTGQLHIDFRILKHQQYKNSQKFDPANCGPKLNRQGHLTSSVSFTRGFTCKAREATHQREHVIETTETHENGATRQ